MAQGKSPQLLIEFNAVRNSDLFSNHWLENRLPLEPEWTEVRAETYAALETLTELWKIQKKRVEKYDGEQMLEEQFIQPVLRALGWKDRMLYQTFLRGRKPDYALFLDASHVDAALSKGKNHADFWQNPVMLAETMKKALIEVRDAPDHAAGVRRANDLIEQYKPKLPSAMACLADDLEASLAHLQLPSLHQKMIRTTNLCERSFVEERRRSKVIPHFFDEKSCLKLVFASLWRASQRWRGVKFTDMERTQLEAYIRVRQAMGKKVRNLAAA